MKIRPLAVQKKGDGRTVALDLFGTQRQQQGFNLPDLSGFQILSGLHRVS